MQLKLINNEFSVCKVVDYSDINLNQEYVFTARKNRLYARFL
jgi:hypothetical protein